MRAFALLAIGLLLLAGCSGKGGGGGADAAASTSGGPPMKSVPGATTSSAPKAGAGSSASGHPTSSSTTNAPRQSGNGTQSITTNSTQEKKGVVIDERFAGMAPVDAGTAQALNIKYALAVPAKTDDIRVIYNATYTGLFSAVVELDDPSGNSVGDSLSTCGVNLSPGAQQSFSCEFHVTKPVAGAWTVQLDWQVGETIEDFTIDVLGTGTVA